jgi:hypothetical protein
MMSLEKLFLLLPVTIDSSSRLSADQGWPRLSKEKEVRTKVAECRMRAVDPIDAEKEEK